MIHFDNARITDLAIHRVGNPARQEPVFLSQESFPITDSLNERLLPYLAQGFGSVENGYRFTHPSSIELNEMFAFTKRLFGAGDAFVPISQHIANHLHEQSEHPKIKTGELLVMRVEELVVQDELVSTLILIKCEGTTPFMQFVESTTSITLELLEGIHLNKPDKGCLICDTEQEQGYRLYTLENGREDTRFWIDHFLQAELEDLSHLHTQQAVDLVQHFANEIVGPERLPERMELIDKSLKYMENNDSFEPNTFAEEVIQTPAYIEQFKQIQQEFLPDMELENLGDFKISKSQLKKSKKQFKNRIKLDSGVDIQLNFNQENQQEFIERGYDSQRGMNYYKIYFNEESE